MITFTVYRKEKNDVNPPVAIATGLTAKSYVDSTALSNKNYLYSVAAVRDSIEKISDELEISTAAYNDYLLYMPFDTDINDHGLFSLTATAFSGAAIDNGSLYVPSNGYITLAPTQSDFNIGTGDFEFGAEILMMSTGQGSFPSIFNIGTAWGTGAVSMQFNASTRQFMCAVMNPTEKDAFAPNSQAFDGATWVKYIVRRVSGVITTYQDSVAGTPLTDNLSINFARNNRITIGAATWALDITRSHSRIKNLYLKVI